MVLVALFELGVFCEHVRLMMFQFVKFKGANVSTFIFIIIIVIVVIIDTFDPYRLHKLKLSPKIAAAGLKC